MSYQYLRTSLQRLPMVLGICIVVSNTSFAADFEHSHKSWTQLLSDVVVVSEDQRQTRVNYQRVHDQTQQLNAYLTMLSDTSKASYDEWDHDQKLSFLINAYNAFTLKLINNNWDKFVEEDAESIRDLGTFFTNPWKIEFFDFFGEKHSLDDIEHEMIRKWFERPRIHVALVCAAVSCPPLRNEAFVAQRLDAQLENQMSLFLADDGRNSISLINGKSQGKAIVELSPIFKWYGEDFEKGHNGFNSLRDMLMTYKNALIEGDSDAEAKLSAIETGNYEIRFKDYDWKLNDVSSF